MPVGLVRVESSESGAARQVAFFRNVNQGQRGHPRSEDLLAGFADAGVEDAATFQSNGTVRFTASDPDDVIADVVVSLMARGVFAGEVFVRTFAFVQEFATTHAGAVDADRRELTLFRADADVRPAEFEEAARLRRCRVIDAGPGWAAVLNDRAAQSNGTPTIEAVLGAPATSRGVPTLARLVHSASR